MTFLSAFRSFSLTCALLAFTAGCSAIPETQSWFSSNHVEQKPAASTTAPGESPTTPSIISTSPLPPATVIQSPNAPAPPPLAAANAKIKAAILLPLSGAHAPLGQAMLNAAQLAVFDVADNHFELMPRDTAGNEAGSEAAARDAINNGAQIIIGPVFASDVNRVKPIAVAAGINMLALTTDASLADQNVYVMGFAPGAQVERVINYAHAQNIHSFAAIIPHGAYGDLIADAFRGAVAKLNDEVAALETYDPARHDSMNAVKMMAPRHDQIGALLLPMGGNDLELVTHQLAGAGFDKQHQHFIGTGLWDTAETGRNDFLVGGWYAAPDPQARANFTKAYVKTYGNEPPRLSTLAYDATALTALIAKQGGHFDRMAITNPNGFSGIDGIFRLTNHGIVERALAVLEVTPKGGHVIDASPTTFVGMSGN